jgi:hypothetical protein
VRALSFALCLLACGCPPDLDRLRVVGGPLPDGGGRDAGGRDSGGVDSGGVDAGGRDPGGGDALLAHMDCDAILSSRLLEEDFLDDTTEFRARAGSFRVEGGEIVFEPTDYALLESLGGFSDVVTCARLRIARTTSEQTLGTGLRGPFHGVNLSLGADDGVARLFSIEPTTNVLVAQQPITEWANGEHDFTVLVYLSGMRAYAEVRDETTGQLVVLSGVYRGDMMAVNATFEGSPIAEEVAVDRVVVGPPTSAAAAVLNGG